MLFSDYLFAENNLSSFKWNTTKTEIEKKYTLIELNIDGLKKNLDNFIGKEFADNFKVYLLDGNTLHEFKNEKFIIFVGFYNNKLQYIAYVTEEIDKVDINENSKTKKLNDVFNVDEKKFKWSAKINIVSEFSVIGWNIDASNYVEIQEPLNKNYFQYTIYFMNHDFYKKIQLIKNISIENNEEIFTRKIFQ